jgi:hypothetical protein
VLLHPCGRQGIRRLVCCWELAQSRQFLLAGDHRKGSGLAVFVEHLDGAFQVRVILGDMGGDRCQTLLDVDTVGSAGSHFCVVLSHIVCFKGLLHIVFGSLFVLILFDFYFITASFSIVFLGIYELHRTCVLMHPCRNGCQGTWRGLIIALTYISFLRLLIVHIISV